MIKPGIRTTELWLGVAIVVLDATSTIPPHARWQVIVGYAGYALSRGLAKLTSSSSSSSSADVGDLAAALEQAPDSTPAAAGQPPAA